MNIVQGEYKDSTYLEPDTMWVNGDQITFTVDVAKDRFDTLYATKEGKETFSVLVLDSNKDFVGEDHVVVFKNTKIPLIDPQVEEFSKDSLGKIYVKDSVVEIDAMVTFIDKTLEEVKIPLTYIDTLDYGNNILTLTYTDPYGNIGSVKITIELDTLAPIVKIHNPSAGENFSQNFTEVEWTVDSKVMDIQTTETFRKEGEHLIVRSFTDIAGNVGSDSVFVKVNYGMTDIEVHVVDKVIRVEDKNPDEYYSKKGRDKPKKEVYSVFAVVKSDQNGDPIYAKPWLQMSPEEKQEFMILHELTWEDESGKHNVTGNFENRTNIEEFNHLGITMEMQLFFPSSKIPEGTMVGDCEEGNLLWDMAVRPIRINVFDQIGQYVTGFDIPEVLIDDDRYLDEKGNVTLRVEMPIPNGTMESANGVSTATGVYLLSTAIATEAIPSACNSVGRKRQTSRSILTPVGYTR